MTPAAPRVGDTQPVGSRVTSTRLIGRAVELDVLRAGLAAAALGEPGMVLVGGDSGAGKTRLLAALREHAEEEGARVFVGDCLELGDAELPYAPLIGALRPLVRDGDPVFDALAPAQRAELGRLLPGLERGAPSRGDRPDASAQSRLFEALLALLDALSADAPVLLGIEDLHWADPSTRACLTFLLRSLAQERVLVVGTYRADELHRRHPLLPLLADLDRDPRVQRLSLQPLALDQVAQALQDILGRTPGPELVERLYARSEGNPLYLEELVAAGPDGRGALPSSLREALMVRIERLDDAAQELLRLLAVGHRLDHALLADASGLDPATLRAALREAVASHLVAADEHGRHVFRHALLREVVADDLLPGERTELHLALARALERRAGAADAGPQVAALTAHHFFEAGERPAALRATMAAADAAECIRAYGEAAGLFERALALWDQVPDPESLAGEDHVSLLARAGEAHFAAGDGARQEAPLRSALAGVDRAADPALAARLLEQLARGQRSQNRTREALDTAREGLALVEGRPSAERAALLGFLSKTRMVQGKWRDAAEIARETLAVAEAVGDRSSEILALDSLGLSLAALGDLPEGCAFLRQAIDMARAHDEIDAACTAYLNLADILHLKGRSDEAAEVLAEGLAIAEPGRSQRWLHTLLAEIALDRGDWDVVEMHLPPPGRRVSGNDLLNTGLRRAELALGRGEQELARTLLGELGPAAAEVAEPQYLGAYGVLLAELRRRDGDLDGAGEAIDEALDRIEFCTEDVMRLARVCAVGLVVEADRAERARDLGRAGPEAKRARACVRTLLARLRATAQDGGPVAQAWVLTGEAHAARARGRSDPARWAKAAGAWEALGRPYPAACARLREAEALTAADDRAAAGVAADSALATAQRLGAGWLAGEATTLIARGRLRVAPAATAAREDGPVPAEDPFGLTTRERQVLALVAQGATNRQIGGELFMAEKTASVHVSRILAKLDVRSRTQAAAVAHRLGLA